MIRLQNRSFLCKAAFDFPKLEEEKAALSKQSEDPSFWKNPSLAASVNRKLADIENKINSIESFKSRLSSIQESLDFLKEDRDQDIFEDADQSLNALNKDFTAFSKSIFYSGPYDEANAILEFHPGAGGTEAHDWAQMLLRRYERYCEANGYRYKIVDRIEGEEAGISSATRVVEGKMAYGNLRSENGVHRLVRISPFDASGSRHTSFASVSVIPEIDDSIEIEIRPEEDRVCCPNHTSSNWNRCVLPD